MACVTAYTDPKFEKSAQEAGINNFYTKPVTKENVDEICNHLQNGSSLHHDVSFGDEMWKLT